MTSSFLIGVFVSGWNWWMNLTKTKNLWNSLKSLFTHESNPWWWAMKGPKALGTILVYSSTNSNLKPKHLSGDLKGCWLNYIDKICLYHLIKHAWMKDCRLITHTHTHTHTYTHTYICVYEDHYIRLFSYGGLLLIVHTWNSSLISSGCNALVAPFQQLLEDSMEIHLCERVNELCHSLFNLLNCLITTASELRE